jgi:hypothetical protein
MQSSTANRTGKNFANSALAQWTLEFRGISHFFADGALHILVVMVTNMSSGFLAPSQVMPNNAFKPKLDRYALQFGLT